MNSEFAQNLSTSKRCQYINQAYYSAIKNRYTPKCIMEKRKINVGLSFLLGHSSVVCTDFGKRVEPERLKPAWKWFSADGRRLPREMLTAGCPCPPGSHSRVPGAGGETGLVPGWTDRFLADQEQGSAGRIWALWWVSTGMCARCCLSLTAVLRGGSAEALTAVRSVARWSCSPAPCCWPGVLPPPPLLALLLWTPSCARALFPRCALQGGQRPCPGGLVWALQQES